MGKRKRRRSDSEDELWRKLKRRLERRRSKRRKKHHDDLYDSEHDYESEDGDVPSVDSEDSYYSDSDERSPRSVVRVPTPPVNKEPTLDDVGVQDQDDAALNASSNPPELPAEILDILGDSKEKEETFGPKIRDEVSKRWGKIIMEGLSKDQKQKVMEGILVPENFQLLKAPKLNPEIAAVLSESTRNRDKRLEKAQNHLGIGIAAITNLMTNLIDGDLDKSDIIKRLSEAGQVLLDLHSSETATRRQLFTYSLDKKFSSMVRDAKRDSFLFGENLGDKIKATKTAEKSGLQIKRKFENQPSGSYRPNRSATRQGNSSRAPHRQYAPRGRQGGARTQAAHWTRRQTTAERPSSSSKSNAKPPPASQSRKTP